eukprot:m.293965 g.293965  ORF g.293965 m.293965 type:complete len:60 (-) comp20026_c0_seq21:74-253(-)
MLRGTLLRTFKKRSSSTANHTYASITACVGYMWETFQITTEEQGEVSMFLWSYAIWFMC